MKAKDASKRLYALDDKIGIVELNKFAGRARI